MENRYFGSFKSRDDISYQFNIELSDKIEILLAEYHNESYEGEAFVLFIQDGKFFEVYGSHCSCYGLEGQWHPEETSIEAIKHYLEKGTRFNRSEMVIELKKIIKKYS